MVVLSSSQKERTSRPWSFCALSGMQHHGTENRASFGLNGIGKLMYKLNRGVAHCQRTCFVCVENSKHSDVNSGRAVCWQAVKVSCVYS